MGTRSFLGVLNQGVPEFLEPAHKKKRVKRTLVMRGMPVIQVWQCVIRLRLVPQGEGKQHKCQKCKTKGDTSIPGEAT